MKIYDISMLIEPSMQVYKEKDEKKPIFTNRSNHKNGKSHETSITIDLHTGTHIDAPLHMIDGGETMEVYDIKGIYKQAKVFDFTNVDAITKEHLQTKDISEGDFILLKTKNSFSDAFLYDFSYLERTGAQYLVEKKVIGVGTDGLGIERDQPQYDTHRSLLNNKIMIVEGLRLKDVAEGTYELLLLPIKLKGVEAAPARALLISQ